MIHAKNGRTAVQKVEATGSPMARRMPAWDRTEQRVETWIKQNPVLGLGLALVVGAGIGFLLKRR